MRQHRYFAKNHIKKYIIEIGLVDPECAIEPPSKSNLVSVAWAAEFAGISPRTYRDHFMDRPDHPAPLMGPGSLVRVNNAS